LTADVDPTAIALLVTEVLDQLGVSHTIGGSLASSFAGEPRSTIDIDIVAALAETHVPAFLKAVSPSFYVDEPALRRAIRDRTAVNLLHHGTYLKVDLFIAGGTPLDFQQLNRRKRVELSDGRVLYVHPPEDILLQKLRWYRRGGEVSDRQWRDILAIIRVQGPLLDLSYLRENAPALAVEDLLQRAIAATLRQAE
jgi:hypothetical protein